MVRLSVNVNKVATLRNSRTRQEGPVAQGLPSLVEAARVCVDAGAPGITVHPRADARHITAVDVLDLARLLEPLAGRVEYNIEGDPREDLLALVEGVRPTQCTLVPVQPGELTSSAGWGSHTPAGALRPAVARLHRVGVRVSLFVEADPAAIRWAADVGADRVELFTEPFARAFAQGPAAGRRSLAGFVAAANLAHELGMGVNAGHDLDLANLELFCNVPHLDEVSIGHALVSHGLMVGLGAAVRDYLGALGQPTHTGGAA